MRRARGREKTLRGRLAEPCIRAASIAASAIMRFAMVDSVPISRPRRGGAVTWMDFLTVTTVFRHKGASPLRFETGGDRRRKEASRGAESRVYRTGLPPPFKMACPALRFRTAPCAALFIALPLLVSSTATGGTHASGCAAGDASAMRSRASDRQSRMGTVLANAGDVSGCAVRLRGGGNQAAADAEPQPAEPATAGPTVDTTLVFKAQSCTTEEINIDAGTVREQGPACICARHALWMLGVQPHSLFRVQVPVYRKRGLFMANEACSYGKRGLSTLHTRRIHMANAACLYGTRGVCMWQTKPIYMAHEAYSYGK